MWGLVLCFTHLPLTYHLLEVTCCVLWLANKRLTELTCWLHEKLCPSQSGSPWKAGACLIARHGVTRPVPRQHLCFQHNRDKRYDWQLGVEPPTPIAIPSLYLRQEDAGCELPGRTLCPVDTYQKQNKPKQRSGWHYACVIDCWISRAPEKHPASDWHSLILLPCAVAWLSTGVWKSSYKQLNSLGAFGTHG